MYQGMKFCARTSGTVSVYICAPAERTRLVPDCTYVKIWEETEKPVHKVWNARLRIFLRGICILHTVQVDYVYGLQA